jgi:hypothetical protein
MKVWITKYALTEGILEVDGKQCREGMISVKPTKPGYLTTYFYGNDWHRTREDAIARAEVMRAKKIASLRKSITKMETLSFKDAE